jgi:hypothetical protein
MACKAKLVTAIARNRRKTEFLTVCDQQELLYFQKCTAVWHATYIINTQFIYLGGPMLDIKAVRNIPPEHGGPRPRRDGACEDGFFFSNTR